MWAKGTAVTGVPDFQHSASETVEAAECRGLNVWPAPASLLLEFCWASGQSLDSLGDWRMS